MRSPSAVGHFHSRGCEDGEFLVAVFVLKIYLLVYLDLVAIGLEVRHGQKASLAFTT